MNPNQFEWLAMQRGADLRREAATDNIVVAVGRQRRDHPGVLTRLAAARERLLAALRLPVQARRSAVSRERPTPRPRPSQRPAS